MAHEASKKISEAEKYIGQAGSILVSHTRPATCKQAMNSSTSGLLDFSTWVEHTLVDLENALAAFISPQGPAGLGEPMRYAVLSAGKRLRPLLTLASFECANASLKNSEENTKYSDLVLRAACAVELMHAYSLVHDDLPCMDNDSLRRGKPTVHVVYGEAQALLAGDALQALAFNLLSTPQTNARIQIRLCHMLAQASGMYGMAGGQAIDLAHVGKSMSLGDLQAMHELKTGALLHTSVMMGAVCSAGSPIPGWLDAYGQKLGLLFQVLDDILDATQDSSTLGKTAGKDAFNHKPTYVTLLGLDSAKQHAKRSYQSARAALQGQANTERLLGLLDMVADRSY